jgi:uncharacterized protein (DUF1697 family)
LSRYFAFLRAINVGGHTVKMDELRRLLEEQGLERVETFIASGNVICEAQEEARELEERIEAGLKGALGYPVAAFVRTPEELSQIAACQPFPEAQFAEAAAFNVAFMKKPLDETRLSRLTAMRNEIDDFRAPGKEVYWLCRVRQSQSTFSNAVLERATGRPSTLRGMNTLKQMAARFHSA